MTLKRGDRFRAFPRRTVRQADGTYATPVYRVTATRGGTIYYGLDADGTHCRGDWKATLDYLTANGLGPLP